MQPDEPRFSVREVWLFLALAAVPIGYLFHEAITRGFVLGQSTLLYQYLPWSAHMPTEVRASNRLLHDVPTQFYPLVMHAREMIRHGQLPVWMAAAGAGMPLLAGFQAAVLSPFTWPVYLLPFPGGLLASVIARMVVAGLGMYVFLRTMPLGRAASLFGATAFLLNSFSMVWLEHPASAAAAWLPWMLVAVDGCVRHGNTRASAFFALVSGCTLIAGHPETAFMLFLLAGPYALYRAIQSRAGLRAVAALAAGGVLGLLVASLQLFPFLEYMQHSRILELRSAAEGPMFANPPSAITAAFVPDFYGNPLKHRYVLPSSNFGEQQAFPGIVTWLAAAMGVFCARHRGRYVFFTAAAVTAMLLMYGTVVARLAAQVIPPLRVAALSRFGLIEIAAVIVLGAIGVDEWLATSSLRQRARLIVMAVAAALAIVLTMAYFNSVQHELLAAGGQLRLARQGMTNAAIAGVAALLIFAAAPSMGRIAAAAGVIGLLMVELVRFGSGMHPLEPREHSFPPLPEIQAIRRDHELFRVTGWVDTLLPNTATVYGLNDVRLYDAMTNARYAEFLDLTLRPSQTTHQLVGIAAPSLLDFLNLKYVLTPHDVDLPAPRFELVVNGPVRVYQNRSVQPRAFLVGQYVSATGDTARRMLRREQVNLTQSVVLDRKLPPADEPVAGGPSGEASIARYEDTMVRIVTKTSQRKLLVLADTYYPGWQARIDGRPAPIYLANLGFRAVSVPEGEHTVEFTYRPLSVRIGAACSAAGLLGIALLFMRSRGRGAQRVA